MDGVEREKIKEQNSKSNMWMFSVMRFEHLRDLFDEKTLSQLPPSFATKNTPKAWGLPKPSLKRKRQADKEELAHRLESIHTKHETQNKRNTKNGIQPLSSPPNKG